MLPHIGTRPLSTSELRLRGTFEPGKHAAAEASEVRNAGIPTKPYGFRAEWEPYWDEALVLLERLGLLTIDHGPALMAYAMACHQVAELTAAIQESGMVDVLRSGRMTANPLLGALDRADGRKRVWMSELGLTPMMWSKAMRSTAKEREDASDPFAAFDALPQA